MTELQAVQLDWRVAPDIRTLLSQLYELFVDAGDTTSKTFSMLLSDSRAKGAQKLVPVDEHGQPDANGEASMIVQCDKSLSRGWKAARDVAYWSKWFLVLEDIVIRLGFFNSESQRLTGYEVSRQNFPQSQCRKTLLDIALTIAVHPSAFGSITTTSGRIMTPKRRDLMLMVVADDVSLTSP